MSGEIQVPGQVPIKFLAGPGDTAQPVSATVATGNGVNVFVSGGLTKIQALSALILAGNIMIPTTSDKMLAQVHGALQAAAMLLKLTEETADNAQRRAPDEKPSSEFGD